MLVQEVIQNAGDAGAKRVLFLLDNTTYGQDPDKLHHPELAQYQVICYSNLFLEKSVIQIPPGAEVLLRRYG